MIEINLVAELMRIRHRTELLQRVAALACLFFFVAAALSVVWVLKETLDLRGRIGVVKGELRAVKDKKREIDDLNDRIATGEPLVALLSQARKSETRMCELLLDVARAVPEDVAVDELRTSDTLRPRVTVRDQPPPPARRGVTITGVAKSNTLVGVFMENLAQLDSFDETFLSYAQQAVDEGRTVFRFEVIALCSQEV